MVHFFSIGHKMKQDDAIKFKALFSQHAYLNKKMDISPALEITIFNYLTTNYIIKVWIFYC